MTEQKNSLGQALRRTSILCGVTMLAATQAYANPMDGVVVGGNASITQAAHITTINQTSNKAIIDWRSFDIGADETTQFIQPSANSIALNRIKDNKPSQIDGRITANGNVILINPNGVVFGATSQVDVNSLVVTSSDVDNDEFMDNEQARFTKAGNADARIVNHGAITVAQAGLAGFVAPNIQNHGTITATLGKVQLASGDSFTLDLAGDGLTQIAASDAITHQLIENSGTIEANGGVIQITAAEARNSIESLVNNRGVIKANGFVQRGGKIILTAGGSKAKIRNTGTIEAKGGKVEIAAHTVEQKGTIDVSAAQAGDVNIQFAALYRDHATSIINASSTQGRGGNIVIEGAADASLYASGQYISSGTTTGGMIDLLAGQDVVLLGALLNTNGNSGGGSIRIGGDYLGSGNTRRARRTWIDEHTLILADATDNGNGGRVIVWADNFTGFHGSISAKGGAYSGNGGFVETSGKLSLDAQGLVNTSAAYGATGTWLLDPTNITISNADSTATMSWDEDAETFSDTTASSSVLKISTLTFQLANNNVIVTTASGLGSAGNITVSNSFTWNSANSLTLLANGSITSNGNITNNGSGALTLSAGSDITVTGNLTLAGGALTLRARNADGATGLVYVGSTISTAGGSVTIGGGSGAITAGSGYAIAASASNNRIGAYVSAITAAGGNIIINGQGGSYSSGGNYGIYVRGAVTTTGTGTITMNGIGGSASNLNFGINIDSVSYSGASVQNSNGSGAISLTGVAGAGTNNYGISASSTSASTILIGYNTSAYTGAITISANGAGLYSSGTIRTTNNAINLSSITNFAGSGNIQTTNNAITITGTTGNMSTGAITTTNAAITLSSVGSITTTALSTSAGAINLTAATFIHTWGITTTGVNNILINSDSDGDADGTSTAAKLGYIRVAGNIATGGGNITLGAGASPSTGKARGSSTNGTHYGVNTGAITAAGGNIIINGQGGAYSSGTNYGVYISSAVTTSGTGTITINGTGGSASNSNYGIYIYDNNDTSDGNVQNSSGSGAITLTGVAGSGTSNFGIYADGANIGYSTSAYTGAITISANGSGLYSSGSIRTTNNAIDLSSITNFDGGGSIQTTNNAITITNSTGNLWTGALTTTNAPITLSSAGNLTTAALSTSAGAINLTSAGSITTTALSTSAGAINLTAATFIHTWGITTTGVNNILINSDSDGDADGTSTAAKLGYIRVAGNIATGGGNITLGAGASPSTGKARGSSTNGTHYGVNTGAITAAGGNIIINGQGGAYSSGTNYGVYISSAVTTSGTGTITINGTGGSASNSNYGIYIYDDNDIFDGNVQNSSGSGAITLTGVAGSGTSNFGIYADGANIGYSTSAYTGNITLVADKVFLTSNTIRTTGDITIKPYSSDGTVGVGTGAGTLAITSAVISQLNWGSSNSLIIGDTTNTGAMEINYTTAFSKKVQFITKSGSDITLSGNLSSSVAGDAIVMAAGGNFLNTTNRTISLTNVGSKRWIIYSTTSGSDSPGGLSNANGSGPYYGYTYNTLAPASVGGSGNTWVYSTGGGTITFTADSVSRYYGDANPSFTYAFACSTGCTYNDAVSGGSISLTSAANATSAVGGYTITAGVGSLTFNGIYAGYTINYVNGTLTVSAAPLTITASANSKTYGDALVLDGATGFTSSGLKNSETIGSVTLVANDGLDAADNAGLYTITASAATGGTFNANNYSISYATGTLTVNKKTLDVIAANTSRAYGSNTVSTTASYTGYVNGHTNATDAGISGTASFTTDATVTSNVGGTYYIRPSAGSLTSTNYSFGSFTDGTLSITQRDLTITAANVSGAYGAVSLNGATGFTTSGLQNSETIGSVTLTTDATTSGAGHYNYRATPWAISASAATGGTFNAANYNISYADASTGLTISRAALTITGVTASNKNYDGLTTATLNTSSAALSGLFSGDVVTLNTGGATGAFGTASAGTNKAVTTSGFTISNTDYDNYTLTQPTTAADIIGRALTITASNNSKTYGDALILNGATGFTYSGLQNGETIGSVTLVANDGLDAADNAGLYTITASAATGGTFDAASYTITYNTGTLTVNKATLTAAMSDMSRAYGTANNFELTYTGFIYSDTPLVISGDASFATTATQGSDIGVYTVTPSVGTLIAANYNFAGFAPKTLTITKANMVVATNNLSKTYGDNNPTLTGSLTNAYAPDAITTTYSTSATQQSDVGSYVINASVNDPYNKLGNYNVTYNLGNLSVTPAELSAVTDNKTKKFLEANPQFTFTLIGLKAWDTEAIFSGYTFSTLADTNSAMGIYAINLAGGSASNYTITRYAGILTIDAPDLPISVITPTPTTSPAPTTNGESPVGTNTNPSNTNPSTNNPANDNSESTSTTESNSGGGGGGSESGFSLESNCGVDNKKESAKCKKLFNAIGSARIQDI